MTVENRRENVRAEIEKAESSRTAARALFGLGLFDECVSRAYMQADYERAFRFSLDGALEELNLAETTCAALRGHLTKGAWIDDRG